MESIAMLFFAGKSNVVLFTRQVFYRFSSYQTYTTLRSFRYATTGNCNVKMQPNEWKGPTLADKSICSSVCPENEGCH